MLWTIENMEQTTKPTNILKFFLGALFFFFALTLLQANWTYQGVCYDANWENTRYWYGTASSQEKLLHLSKLGVNAISVTPFAFQSNVNRPFIRFQNKFDPGLEKDIKKAKELGLKVIMKPHIWSDQFLNGTGYWRGSIFMQTGADKKAWFQAYKKMIVHFAEQAQRLDVDLLVIGLEYVKMTKRNKKQWREIIQAIRKVYQGPLTYGANDFEEAEQIGFWEDLDYIGINAYFPLSQKEDPSLEELKQAWWKHRETLQKLSKYHKDKKIILTEVGYSSAEGTAKKPHAWPNKYSKTDEHEQARCYKAMLSVLSGASWLEGMFIWKYKIGITPASLSKEPSEAFFVFQNKLAEEVIKNKFLGTKTE